MKRPNPLSEEQIKTIRQDRSVRRPSVFSEKFGAGAELSGELIQLRAVIERIADAMDRIAAKITEE